MRSFTTSLSISLLSLVLEAAHIFPYLGIATNDLRNGILLRSDLHILFDAHLISFEYVERTLKVLISTRLDGSHYAKYRDKIINLPRELMHQPALEVVSDHLKKFRAKELMSDRGLHCSQLNEGTLLETGRI